MGNSTSNKIAVITSIAGGKDDLLTAPQFTGIDSILFTDVPLVDYKGWSPYRLHQFSNLSRPDRRHAKLPKILPFMFLPSYEFIIWQDGGHVCLEHPEVLLGKYIRCHKKDIAAFRHGKSYNGEDHNCIYKEAENIKKIGFLEDSVVIDEQVKAYKDEGFPENYGLSCNSAIIWRNSPPVITLQLAWWEQICKYSSRDQMSFFYSLWKTNMSERFTYLDGHWENNVEISRLRGHVNPRQ